MPHHNLSFPIIPAAEVQVRFDAPIIRAIEIIDRSDAKIALVVDEAGKMVGSLTDGDVRRGLLKGFTVQSPVGEIMHANPQVMPAHSSKQQILDGMLLTEVKQMPLIAADGTLVGIAIYDALTGFIATPRPNRVVIMAGGKGKRLLPITQDIPKPMVEVGGKPMLERIIQHFVRQGFSHFDIAVNYLSHVIEDYFGDGSKWECRIHYVREKEFLGTAGALSLIMPPPAEPFIVINGDIMTSVDFCGLLDYHTSCESMATVCARAHRVEVPFGVIQMKDNMMQAIVEKPVYEDLVSAGIYVLDPKALTYVPKNSVLDMPSLLQHLVQDNCKVAVFPMHEEWADVGRHDDLEQVKRNFSAS
jgi:dTDP-glucose pyrophosphorylase